MNNKFRVIALTVLILTFAVLFCSCGKGKDGSPEGLTDVYEAIDYGISEVVPAEEEETYASYETPFQKEVQNEIYRLAAESEKNGEHLALTGAYASAEGTPTVILSYTTAESKTSFLICKFKDGRLFKTVIETDVDNISAENDLLIFNNSDIIALRTGTDTKSGRQIIYDFTDGDYCAVKDNDVENGKAGDMDDNLKAYNEKATDSIKFSEKAQTDNISDYVRTSLNIELSDV